MKANARRVAVEQSMREGGGHNVFRDFLATLRREHLLVEIDDEVDWNLQAGAIMRYCNEHRSAAQLFSRMKDASPGMSLASGLYATYERLAVAFGLPKETPYHDLVEFYGKGVEKRIKPIVVNSGPCQENVLLGEDIDLYKFPIARTHSSDGGRYLFTVNSGVCRDPETDWVNWGCYRGMVHSRNAVGLFLRSINHGGRIMNKYHASGKTMDFVSFQGGDPLHYLTSASGIPYQVAEVDVVGGIRGRPVELVKCKTVDLYVPADAEFVVEGTIAPGDMLPEGPFGEYPGYTVAEVTERPVLRVSAITHRTDPILTCVCLGIPQDDETILGLQVAGTIKQSLLKNGIPVVRVAVPAESGWHGVIVSTKKPFAGIPQIIAYTVWTDRIGRYMPYVIVVDEDVDPADLSQVFHAICTKCEPQRDIHIQRNTLGGPLAPFIKRNEFKEDGVGGSNVLLDCTWPYEWAADEIPIREAFDTSYSDSVKESAMAIIKKFKLQ